jgi:nicotinate-nucleotide pyrophosphorylase (carboxylating)
MKNDKFKSHLVRRLRWDEIDAKFLASIIEIARNEDIAGFGLKEKPAHMRDITTDTLTPHGLGSARLMARKDMCVCGLNMVGLILGIYAAHDQEGDCSVKLLASDGECVSKGAPLAEISGPARTMIRAERIMLNFLQHLSGVSTLTAEYVKALGDSKSMILDTRKTTPCFRALEKYAVACGGAYTHRMGLFDRVMLKDNHLAASDATRTERLAEAVRVAKKMNPDYAVEVEVDEISQIPYVLEAEADVIMFDNFTVDELRKGVEIVGDRAWTEASGGITLETINEIGKVGVDFISSGALVHQSAWIDIGLDWI